MKTLFENYLHKPCKILVKQDHEPHAHVHFGFITLIDEKNKMLSINEDQQLYSIPFSDIIAIRMN